MVLEATMICIDNSEWMRNGDYSPSRFQAQADAVNLICGAKTQSNPENTVGVLIMAGKGVRVLVTPTSDLGKILACMHGLEIGGEMNLAAGIQVAQLALKHRQNKKQHQRIIVFAGSHVKHEKKMLEMIGRKLKKNSVALDVVNFGEEDEAKTEKLEALVAAVFSQRSVSHYCCVLSQLAHKNRTHPTKMVISSTVSHPDEQNESIACTFASRYVREQVPKFKMPENSIPKDAAYQIINDELMLDGKPRLNLASFVTTWMEPECDKLIMDSLNKNYVDMDEYPVTTELQNRCVNIIAHLFNAPIGSEETAVGVGTVGSSEAIMLAGLAFKRKWQTKRKAEGKPYDKPNIVTGANVQVCWEKFARYFEVELKEVKLTEDYYVMDPLKAVEMVDENTICVAAILGSTLTGEFEDVKLLNELLTKKNKETGWDTPIHVDAASGGFVAPFLYPDLLWDFRLPLVKSINVSGHKYGLVYPGIGWVVWRHKADLPDDLVFHINYLGSDQPTFTLNFSKGSSQIIAQYYQFIRLGFEGYKNVMENCLANTRTLKEGIEKTGRFKIVSKDIGVPLVAFSLKDSSKHTVFEIADHLRKYGWIVPAYTMPADAKHIAVLRVVIREDFSCSLAERLVSDIEKVVNLLDTLPSSINSKDAHVAVIASETSEEVKKDITETQAEILRYWKKLVDGKRVGAC